MSENNYARELLQDVGAKRFAYDHEKREFTIGSRRVSVADAGKNTVLLTPDIDDESVDADPMLASVMWNHVMYPGMYDWLNDHFSNEVADETVGVMVDVFADLRPDLDISKYYRGTAVDQLLGFSAVRSRSEHPHVTLTVLGNCACYGVSVDGVFGYHDWSSKFAGFEMHNIDAPEQSVSLQAGLGHLAFKAEQDGL